LFFLCLQNIPALDIAITEKEAEASLKGEYNRSLLYYGELSSAGRLELNSRCTFSGGISLGKAEGITDIKLFTAARVDPLEGKPLHLTLGYIYNGLPEYEAHSHTILPVVAYNAKRAGIAIGMGLRFTSFFTEPALFESMLSFSGYFNFINNETLCIGINCANFDDFSVKNMGAYSFGLNSSVRLNGQWSLINELRLLQSGSVGLSSNFYGIALRTGVKFTW